ncbi:TonB-dependent receptor [Pedobacter sp. BMA]|uniref:TonB-dependent receptor n=1 Tax=Pedobacter sp. BMA TaxID=1663685 RepID=UPI00064A5D50|nr:TonB-dependent receptor [Pedobacter sp. BMA]KLT64191.1 energy transducer TonB [Pedobacter sp. BMA]
MQIKKILLTGILCAYVIFSYAQNLTSTVSGIVKGDNGDPIPGATIKIQKSNYGTISDANGVFQITNIAPGAYSIHISAIGFKTQKRDIRLNAGQDFKLNVTIAEDAAQMETVNVLGRTKAQEVNRQAFNVTAIDATKLYNTTLDISGALDKVAGVRVRETGGVGSSFNVSLNGFSGNHIRYFIDGIPMDNFGSSFQINNIPINVAERVEVYKGVVPMWLGSDALGGAVNIVTGNTKRNYIDASYSYGSFNTHRSVVNAAATTKSGVTFQLSAFQNYSDNDYKTDLPQRLLANVQGTTATSLRRFNDTYHNETLIANVGLVGKKFADNLLLGITLGQNYKEIQTGARPDAVFGQLHRRGTIIMPSLKYKKSNLVKGLDVTLNANYNLGFEKTIDTAYAKYDWDGIRDPKATMGEREGGQLSKFTNNNGLATAMVSYQIAPHHSVAINNVFSTFNRKTDNILYPDNNASDPAKKVNKNVLGFGYSYAVDNKWSSSVFGKYIYQNNLIGSRGISSSTEKLGYGLALAYFFNRNVQLRTSYELTNRMPEATEIFGDLENQEANPALKPERSDNLNLGLIYSFQINEINRFSLTANGVYRYSADFIYNRLNNNQTKTVADNREGVRTLGADAEIRYSYKNWLSAGTTITYQYLQNLQQYEPGYNGESPVYLDQMPNIPYLFGNTDVSTTFTDFGKKGNNLTIGYNLLYVHAFWLYWPSLGSKDAAADKKVIPMQMAHDLNLVYSIKNGRYNISFEARNITDKPLFDNFSLQKPGRGFYLNLRYFINKS